MSSGIIPTDGSVCCICWEGIPQGKNARDATGGQAWDVHDGACAAEAGLDNLPVGVAHPLSVRPWISKPTRRELEVQDP